MHTSPIDVGTYKYYAHEPHSFTCETQTIFTHSNFHRNICIGLNFGRNQSSSAQMMRILNEWTANGFNSDFVSFLSNFRRPIDFELLFNWVFRNAWNLTRKLQWTKTQSCFFQSQFSHTNLMENLWHELKGKTIPFDIWRWFDYLLKKNASGNYDQKSKIKRNCFQT